VWVRQLPLLLQPIAKIQYFFKKSPVASGSFGSGGAGQEGGEEKGDTSGGMRAPVTLTSTRSTSGVGYERIDCKESENSRGENIFGDHCNES